MDAWRYGDDSKLTHSFKSNLQQVDILIIYFKCYLFLFFIYILFVTPTDNLLPVPHHHLSRRYQIQFSLTSVQFRITHIKLSF